MFLSDLSIRKPVLITMVVMSFAVIGLYSFLRLGVDNWPDVNFPFAVVSVIYPGAGPEEIESQVIKPVEDEITTIAGIRHITSQCLENRGLIFVEFELGTKIDFAAMDIKDKVDAILPLLPEDLEPPVVLKFDLTQMPIMNLALQSTRPPDELYEIADDVVKARLNRVSGLAQIDIVGGRKREIQVAVSRSQLRAHDLTVMDVIGGLKMANLNMPGGRIEEGRRDVTIRLEGEFATPAEMEKTILALDGGRTVRLRDIARVYDSYEDEVSRVRYDGQSSVGLSLRKRSDANTVAVAEGVKAELAAVQKLLPADVKLSVARDNSVFIRESLADVSSNLVMGILLTALVLFLFLRSWEGTVIASVAMPVSIVATFLLIDAAGFTLNSMTLMGLSISAGILVNNAIIVLENINVFRDRGFARREAAAKGTSEIALAVAASTLTNIVVFVPIGFMGGIVGSFFREFGLTVAFATVFSLIVSFTLTPMMASRKLTRTAYVLAGLAVFLGVWLVVGFAQALGPMIAVGALLLAQRLGWLGRFFQRWDRVQNAAIESYRNALAWCMNRPGRVIGAVAILFLLSFPMFTIVGAQFFPKTDQGEFYVGVKLPPGTRLNETDAAMSRIEHQIRALPELKDYYTTAGASETGWGETQGSQLGGVYVRLVDLEHRQRSTDEIIRDLRKHLADVPAADVVITGTSTFGGGGEGDLQIEIAGNVMADLLSTVDQVQAIVAETKGTVDVTNTWITGKPELKVVPRRNELADQGIHAADVATTLRALFEGIVATNFRQSGKEYDVRVRLDKSDRERLDQVRSLEIKANDRWLPLTAVAAVSEAGGPTTIYRKDKQRLVMVTANITQGTVSELMKTIQTRLDGLQIPSGISVQFGGEAEFMGREFAYIYRAMLLATILTYMLLCAMLESYIRPLMIMLTLPLGFIGMSLMLVLTNNPVSLMVLMGMVMLVGIVVNNAILIIDYAEVLRAQGKSVREATLEAGPGRFRPIVMANLASILGMMPLALGIGAGAGWRSPMAVAAIGALISSTMFTLFLIPTIYEFIESRRERRAAK